MPDRSRRVLGAMGQLVLVAVVFLAGSKWVVRSLNNGGHVHVVLGLAGSRARLVELTPGVSLRLVRDSLARDDLYAVCYGVALLIASIGKDGVRIRRLQKLYFNVRVLAVMTSVSDLIENTVLRSTLRNATDAAGKPIGLTYTSDAAAEIVRAASILKWTCLVGALVATVVRLGSTILPQSKPKTADGRGFGAQEGAETPLTSGDDGESSEPSREAGISGESTERANESDESFPRTELGDRRNRQALVTRQLTDSTAQPETTPLDVSLEQLSQRVKGRMARRWQRK